MAAIVAMPVRHGQRAPMVKRIFVWFWRDLMPHLVAPQVLALLGIVGALLLSADTAKFWLLFVALTLVFVSGLALAPRTLKELRKLTMFAIRTQIHHDFVHRARDLMLQLMAPAERPIVRRPDRAPFLPRLDRWPLALKGVTTMMGNMVRLFKTFVPAGVRVWVNLRELRSDGCFHTVERVGDYSSERVATSRPLHKSRDATIAQLRDSYRSGKCVVLTGAKSGAGLWTPQPNDRFGEDECVLMGAVIVKKWKNGEFGANRMVWVLSVCATDRDAFDASHLSLMQSCVDIFSMIANVIEWSGDLPVHATSDEDPDGLPPVTDSAQT